MWLEARWYVADSVYRSEESTQTRIGHEQEMDPPARPVEKLGSYHVERPPGLSLPSMPAGTNWVCGLRLHQTPRATDGHATQRHAAGGPSPFSRVFPPGPPLASRPPQSHATPGLLELQQTTYIRSPLLPTRHGPIARTA